MTAPGFALRFTLRFYGVLPSLRIFILCHLHCRLPPAICPLPHRSLLTSLLTLTAHCPPPTAHCSLLSGVYSSSTMKFQLLRILAFIILATVARGQTPPAADHHQHIFSPPLVKLLMPGAPESQTLAAADVIALLDKAGIQRALLLSVAYTWGNPSRTIEDEYAKVRAENDWNSAQAALYPKRLRVFCSFNPLEDYALAELERCAKDPNLKRGLKLHFGNSDVQLENPAHVEQVGRVFRAANKHRMTIVVHLRASISKQRPYGAIQARVFLEQLLPLARNIDVQVAHLAGTGPGYNDPRCR